MILLIHAFLHREFRIYRGYLYHFAKRQILCKMMDKVVCTDIEYLLVDSPLHYDFAVLDYGRYFTDPGIDIYDFNGCQGLCFLNQLLGASHPNDLVSADKRSRGSFNHRHPACLRNLHGQGKDNLLSESTGSRVEFKHKVIYEGMVLRVHSLTCVWHYHKITEWNVFCQVMN